MVGDFPIMGVSPIMIPFLKSFEELNMTTLDVVDVTPTAVTVLDLPPMRGFMSDGKAVADEVMTKLKAGMARLLDSGEASAGLIKAVDACREANYPFAVAFHESVQADVPEGFMRCGEGLYFHPVAACGEDPVIIHVRRAA